MNANNTANVSKLGYIGRQPTTKRNSDSWFTPEVYLDSVRTVLGEITLDPFSDSKANDIVKAAHFFNEQQDGLSQNWKMSDSCKVFMNPPYSSGMVKQCCARFVEGWHQKEFIEGIILVNNATETKWFQSLLNEATAICFTDHRISFWNSDGKVVSNNTRGQAFFYFGINTILFNKQFQKHGYCQALDND